MMTAHREGPMIIANDNHQLQSRHRLPRDNTLGQNDALPLSKAVGTSASGLVPPPLLEISYMYSHSS